MLKFDASIFGGELPVSLGVVVVSMAEMVQKKFAGATNLEFGQRCDQHRRIVAYSVPN